MLIPLNDMLNSGWIFDLFPKEEIDGLKSLKTKLFNLTTALGEIEITKLDLENRRKLIEQGLSDLFNEEKDLAKKLEEKYGKGNISLETGEFSAIK